MTVPCRIATSERQASSSGTPRSEASLRSTDPAVCRRFHFGRVSLLLALLPIVAWLHVSGAAAEQPLFNSGGGLCLLHGENAGKIDVSRREKPPIARELGVGEWKILPEVCPREKFFPTSVLATPGATYRISATGRWKDSWITVGPEGWWFPPFHPFNRLPWRRMFVLSGSLGPSLKTTFVIARQSTWTAPADLASPAADQLMLFPNDWDGKYDNNRALSPAQGGPMRVSIQRLS